MSNHIVESYIQNPTYNQKLENPDITQEEWNPLCGDKITVYLKIQDNIVQAYSYDWELSRISKWAAAFLGDIIIGESIQDILQRDITTIESHDFIVSARRKRAAVIALLACKNAIHTYQKDWVQESFDDILYNR